MEEESYFSIRKGRERERSDGFKFGGQIEESKWKKEERKKPNRRKDLKKRGRSKLGGHAREKGKGKIL
mgnify:FL=1